MKNIPNVIKMILNILLFGIYSLIWVIIWDWLINWFIPNMLGKEIPSISDPIHMKVAILVIVFIILITGLLRKYFYLSCKKNTNESILKNKSVIEKAEKELEKLKVEKKEELDNEMKIYIDKEIK